ncbi:hypothetical protein [Aquamicrobium soli]|jgi:hypothetical protein|uniref:Uncharacterized protein n=1 Tax=Aquamicrobium soli TaxID=1811518 RepID=A0ABV7KBM3_9HYPH
MFSAPASIVAAMRRALSAPRPFERIEDDVAEPSGTALRELIFKAAGQTLGECPPWVLIAIEQARRENAHRSGRQKRMPPC